MSLFYWVLFFLNEYAGDTLVEVIFPITKVISKKSGEIIDIVKLYKSSGV